MIAKFFILLVLASILFLRGDIEFLRLAGFNAAQINLVAIVTCFLLVLKRFSINGFGIWLLLSFYLVSLFILFFQVLFNSADVYVVLRFSAELILNIILVLIGFNLWKQLNLRSILKYHIVLGVFFSMPVIWLSLVLTKVRRIGAGGDEEAALPVAVNHLGHSLMICLLFLLTYLLVGERRYRFTCFVGALTIGFGVVLTGSKAAVLGILPFAILMLFMYWKKFLRFLLLGFAPLGLTFFLSNDKFSNLILRFNTEAVFRGVSQRSESFSVAMSSSPDVGSILGWADRYQLITHLDPIIYPHNIFLSIYLHLGVFPLIAMLMFMVFVLIKFATLRDFNLVDLCLLSVFLTIFFYSSTSGRLTRIMTYSFYFAMISGYFYYRGSILINAGIKLSARLE